MALDLGVLTSSELRFSKQCNEVEKKTQKLFHSRGKDDDFQDLQGLDKVLVSGTVVVVHCGNTSFV